MRIINIMEEINENAVNIVEEGDETKPVIKHLVLAGGGTYGIAAYGALKETHQKGFWDIKNIIDIHSTSIGGIIAIMIVLGYDWETLDAYIIRRPWNVLFKYDIRSLLNAYDNCGIFDQHVVESALKPLFLGKDINIDVTLEEFYNKTGINIYFYTCELNSFQLRSISHHTHPSWRIIDAVYTSSSLPIFFKPLCVDGESFIDGGLMLNYPLRECLKQVDVRHEEVLGINKVTPKEPTIFATSESNLVDYFMHVFNKLLECAMQDLKIESEQEPRIRIKNQIDISMEPITASSLYEFAASDKYRIDTIQKGVNAAQEFLERRLL